MTNAYKTNIEGGNGGGKKTSTQLSVESTDSNNRMYIVQRTQRTLPYLSFLYA